MSPRAPAEPDMNLDWQAVTSFQRVSLVFRARGLRVDAIKRLFRDYTAPSNATRRYRCVSSDLIWCRRRVTILRKCLSDAQHEFGTRGRCARSNRNPGI